MVAHPQEAVQLAERAIAELELGERGVVSGRFAPLNETPVAERAPVATPVGRATLEASLNLVLAATPVGYPAATPVGYPAAIALPDAENDVLAFRVPRSYLPHAHTTTFR